VIEAREDSGISLTRVRQVGVVVRNVDEAVEYYSSNFGVSPFRTVIRERRSVIVHGKPVDYKVKLAFADLGQIQLELIEVLEGETIHTEFLRERGEGLHHLGFHVEDLDAEVSRWGRRGFGVLQRTKPGGPGFAYMDTAGVSGVILELIQRASRARETES
jgi:methylmalonyl-CoA/ethylmalonyl-CoA epimerase